MSYSKHSDTQSTLQKHVAKAHKARHKWSELYYSREYDQGKVTYMYNNMYFQQ